MLPLMRVSRSSSTLALLLAFLLLLASVLAACSQTAEPPVEQPGPEAPPASDSEPPASDAPQVMTPEQCKTAGGTVVPSPGGDVKCPDGQTELGKVRLGIEGGVCCK